MAENRKNTSRSKTNRRYSVKKQRRKTIIIAVAIAVVVVLLGVGLWAYLRFHTYDGYKVVKELDMTNTDERTTYLAVKKGFIRCAGDGITFFDRGGIEWAETYEMTQPLTDTCGNYIVVADLKGSDVYIFDQTGLVNRITVEHPILDVEVSEQGVVAAATNDGASNYIEVLDKEGNNLITAKSVFASSGYLTDISLSENGSSLAAAFIYVSEGTLESKVVFYDFSGTGEITGGFNQYKDMVVTNVEFLNSNTVCAVADGALTFYKVSSTPSIIHEEMNLNFEIQSLFFSKNKVGLVVEDESSSNSYTIKVYNAQGSTIMDHGVDFPYTNAALAGNCVLLYSASEAELYSFAGIRKFAGPFDERIEYLVPAGSESSYIYATAGKTEFINLK